MNSKEPKSILITDCGSTTTKAILIEKSGSEYRLKVRGEAPTTVEAPYDDVTVGVINATTEVEELAGWAILNPDGTIRSPATDGKGVDLFLSTSSAGGGLQMMVAGVVRSMTAESAERAALGAGAIVMDTIACNDRRLPHEQIERIRRLRPDMILISGGVDGGTITHVAEISEIISAADPKPRLGSGFKLPVVFAGNRDATEPVKKILEKKTALEVVGNLRPVLERENLKPAREKIHELFMEHVMAQAPGYSKLKKWTHAPIMPTPGAVGEIMQAISREEGLNLVGVDIGGATTDVFSVFQGNFTRTVSANLGMSYSVSNVLTSAGEGCIMRWIPFDIPIQDLRNWVKNKMIRPTTIPHLLDDLMVEQALAREALRLAFDQHRKFATGLKGIQQARTIADTFEQRKTGESLINMMDLDILVGSGGVLSHAPRRVQAALMMVDSFQPEGVTRLAVDSIFMMPHLGVLSTLHPKAARDVFFKDCIVFLGTCIAPSGPAKPGKEICTVEIEKEGTFVMKGGTLARLQLGPGEKRRALLRPARHKDVGAGPGREREVEIPGGVVGILLDGRGRPFQVSEDRKEAVALIREWNRVLEVYPE